MKTVFLDTNIVLDVFLCREEFSSKSVAVWEACVSGKIGGMISAMTLNTVHYVCAKSLNRKQAIEAVRLILTACKIVALDEKILWLAADNPGNDFEDAIQLYSALEAKASCIITRDVNDFPKGLIPIFTPGEFLATF